MCNKKRLETKAMTVDNMGREWGEWGNAGPPSGHRTDRRDAIPIRTPKTKGNAIANTISRMTPMRVKCENVGGA